MIKVSEKCKSLNGKWKRAFVLVLLFLVILFTVSELAVFAMYGIPMIAIYLFKVTGLSIESGVALSNFSLSDLSVMFMMWILPCLFCTVVGAYVHCKLIKLVAKKSVAWLRYIFNRPQIATGKTEGSAVKK